MKLEYLIFNLIILLSPLIANFFYEKTLSNLNIYFFLSNILSSIIFIIHDIKVNNSWWSFNKKYITDIKIFNLPIEEIIFFPIVSFSTMIIWINLKKIIFEKESLFILNLIFFGLIFISFLFLYLKNSKPYLKFINYLFILLIIVDLLILKINLILKFNFLIFSIFIFLLTFIFNYYLTKRPVVIYNKKYLTNIKILTIPIEDFLYGFNFIYLSSLFFEFFSRFSIFFK
ncbi:MAG: lycopene cyclase domain-containing protein [Patescibacteria group bacterium]|nr:lycopene cyclase domain-containing protein [Patescibacteria group bacterium]